MLLNYLKLSLRLLIRNPFFTFINVLGLSVGFASFFILWEHSSTELKADQFHKDFERIVRLNLYWQWTDDGKTWGMNTFGATRSIHAPMFKNDFPEVENYTSYFQQPDFNEDLVGHGKQVIIQVERNNGAKDLFEETRVVYADPNLFDFFGLPLVQGSPTLLLSESKSVALSQTTATKYFGNQDPLGKLLMLNDTILLKVTGVFRDLPNNTHLAFDVVISNVNLTERWRERYYPLVATYLKLHDRSQIANFEKQINKFKEIYWARELKPNFKVDFFSQPLKDLSFNPQYWYVYNHSPKSRSLLLFFQVISVLILIMAWINYINIAVSRMIKRMMEVATRKMSGAQSSDFVKQFFVEAALVNVIALAFAFTMIQLIRNPAALFLQIHIQDVSSIACGSWLLFGFIMLLGISVTGFYPVIMSISFNPRSLIAKSKGQPQKKWLPSFLVTSQYASAITLIIWTFIVYLQLNFILHKDTGLSRDQTIIVDAPVTISVDSSYTDSFDYYLNTVRNIPGVRDATSSYNIVGDSKLELFWVNNIRQPDLTAMYTNGGVDENFIPFYGLKLIAGRNFLPTDKADAIIVSRYAAFRLGFNQPEEAVGSPVKVRDGKMIHIIGVIEDYRFISLANLDWSDTENVTGNGVCLVYKNHLINWYTQKKLSVKIEADKREEVLAEIRETLNLVFPGNIFNWYFLNDHINKVYNNEKINRNQIIMFTVLAIGISCLGLLGTITLKAEERIKEIGIRKVLGAGIKDIGAELLSSVLRQFIVSLVVALPVSYYLTTEYLGHYLEKINLNWWHFALPVLIFVVIMFLTIASILWKAAKSNPVEALKYE